MKELYKNYLRLKTPGLMRLKSFRLNIGNIGALWNLEMDTILIFQALKSKIPVHKSSFVFFTAWKYENYRTCVKKSQYANYCSGYLDLVYYEWQRHGYSNSTKKHCSRSHNLKEPQTISIYWFFLLHNHVDTSTKSK